MHFVIPLHAKGNCRVSDADTEILLGKYLAVLAIYTVALGFSMTHAVVLAALGDPDWGVLLATYFGYWIAGGALLAAGWPPVGTPRKT